jgi:hypothetical protein
MPFLAIHPSSFILQSYPLAVWSRSGVGLVALPCSGFKVLRLCHFWCNLTTEFSLWKL